MEFEIKDNTIFFSGVTEFDARKTFGCGQCFRWRETQSGEFAGVAFGNAAVIRQDADRLYIRSSLPEPAFWANYLDLGRDYESIRRSFSGGGFLKAACEYGAGIRILKQERWETLCSFILSQCNNIPRIMGIVERLSRLFGEPFEFDGEVFYSFPEASRLAALEPEDLAELRCGYRAKYVINAARAVSNGEIDLDELARGSGAEAKKSLKTLNGVGDKVADCVVLFGLGIMDAFPVDVWMRRALREHFPEKFDPGTLGAYAGLAQQYIFYYARSEGRGRG